MNLLNKIILFSLCLLVTSCSFYNQNKEIKYKAYVINLDRAPERMKIATQQLKSHNIKFERFTAIDGYQITFTDLITGDKFTGRDLKEQKIKLTRGKKYFVDCGREPEINFIYHRVKKYMLTAGELGCTCSHRGVLTKAIRDDLDIVVIFEDDIKILSDEFAFLFYSAINQLPPKSVAFLDAHGPSLVNIERNRKISSLFIPLNQVPVLYGNYALIYDRIAARATLKAGSVEIMAIDDRVANQITNHKISGYLLNKKTITYAPEAGSDIKEMGRPH